MAQPSPSIPHCGSTTGPLNIFPVRPTCSATSVSRIYSVGLRHIWFGSALEVWEIGEVLRLCRSGYEEHRAIADSLVEAVIQRSVAKGLVNSAHSPTPSSQAGTSVIPYLFLTTNFVGFNGNQETCVMGTPP